MPGTSLGSKDTTVNKTSSCSHGIYHLVWVTDNKHIFKKKKKKKIISCRDECYYNIVLV